MLDVDSNLIITRDTSVENATLIENCSDHYEQLTGFSIYLPDSRIPYVEDYLNSIPNGNYILSVLNHNVKQAMRMILSISKITSYTEVFIDIYGGVQGILDAFAKAEEDIDGEIDNEKFLETSTPIDNTPVVSMAEQYKSVTEDNSSVEHNDYIENEKSAGNTISNEVEMKTGSDEAQFYNKEMEHKDEQQVPATIPSMKTSNVGNNGMEFQMFLQQLICKAMQPEKKEPEDCLSIKELRMVQRKIASTDAEKIKTSVLDMLDDISTHDDMVFMTKFLEMFIDKLGGFHE